MQVRWGLFLAPRGFQSSIDWDLWRTRRNGKSEGRQYAQDCRLTLSRKQNTTHAKNQGILDRKSCCSCRSSFVVPVVVVPVVY